MKSIIEKHVLKNAADFNGKANPNAVLGRILSEHPELRKDVPKLMKQIQETIKSVEKLSADEQKKKLAKEAPELLNEKKEVKKTLEMPNIQGNIVLRFAPSPSGPLHIGHAYVLSLNAALAKKYDGKLLLRIEDTNPENIYDKAYEMIPNDAQWLTKGAVSDVIIQSDRLGHYYDTAEKLIAVDKAYICTCNPDKFKRLLTKGKACPCRILDKKTQHERYDKMFGEFKPGEAVMRLRTDLADKNPAMRDFALMRINDTPHPRQKKKQRVWPLMNLAVTVDDHLLNVTHTVRGKDHIDNDKRQKKIADALGWEMPTALYVGKINFTDIRLKTSQTKKEILAGKYTGWDDIRLPFLLALKRRGYQPDAFSKYAVEVGLTENDKKVTKQEFFKNINHLNKEVLDPQSNRYFFIADPVKIKVTGAPQREVSLHLHPDFHARGERKFKVHEDFIIARKDFDALEPKKVHRLMDCLNFVVDKKRFLFTSLDYEKFKNAENRGAIIHWLPTTEKLVDVSVLMEDGSTVKGKAEHHIEQLPEGAVVQFERFGFCRLDKKSKNKYEFWFAHR